MTTYLQVRPIGYILTGVALLPVLAMAGYISYLIVPIIFREVVVSVVRAVVD